MASQTYIGRIIHCDSVAAHSLTCLVCSQEVLDDIVETLLVV